jgi:hypothetical protein
MSLAQFGIAAPFDRMPSGNQMKEDYAETINIASCGRLFATEKFGRHVERRAADRFDDLPRTVSLLSPCLATRPQVHEDDPATFLA